MTQRQRLEFLLRSLLAELPDGAPDLLPDSQQARRRLLRTLVNLRPPRPASAEFLRVQDDYLAAELASRNVVSLDRLVPAEPGLYLWRGDITALEVDAVVNAANAQLLGCFCPCHGCIDNAIHTAAGVQLRLCCAELMARQGHEEPPGGAKLTPAYNLPCRAVLHTVGPIVRGPTTERDRRLLASCYRSCLELAAAHRLRSVAFCCISTGEYRFPREEAAQIAVETVRACRAALRPAPEVVFDVFTPEDERIYQALLGRA